MVIEKAGFEIIFLVLDPPHKGDTFIIKNVFSSPEDLIRHSDTKEYERSWIVPTLRRSKKNER